MGFGEELQETVRRRLGASLEQENVSSTIDGNKRRHRPTAAALVRIAASRSIDVVANEHEAIEGSLHAWIDEDIGLEVLTWLAPLGAEFEDEQFLLRGCLLDGVLQPRMVRRGTAAGQDENSDQKRRNCAAEATPIEGLPNVTISHVAFPKASAGPAQLATT
jgi:hypothetical protein